MKNIHQELIDKAAFYVGVVEEAGKPNGGPNIAEFLASVGLAEGHPWCSAFVSYCIQSLADVYNIKPTIFITGHVMTMWNKSPASCRSIKPAPGFLVLWRKEGTTSGHIGIVESVEEDGTFSTIEGNTSDGQGMNRDGDGVWRKKRHIHGYGNMKLLGFLSPWA